MIAEDHDYGLPIFWDLFFLNNVRTSHNVSIVGSTGAGKSFLLKKLILHRQIKNMGFSDFCDYYLDWFRKKPKKPAPGTIRSYKQYINALKVAII